MTLSPRSVSGVTLLQAIALLLPLLAAGWASPVDLGRVLAVAVLTALLWELLFAGVRKRAMTFHGITTAMIATLLCGGDVALWQLAIAVSLGVVFGELIFGGRGFGFVSPAALSLSLLIVAFPDVALRAPTPEMALSVLPGLAVLVVAGLVSISVLAGVAIGVALILLLTGQPVMPAQPGVALAIGAVFLIADPTAASVTRIGRWLYGALAGVLVVVFSPNGAITPEAVAAAALFASVFAPLIDHGAERMHLGMRRRNG